jgi:hypothetical protein
MLLSRLSMTKVMKALINQRGQARLPNPELIEVEL